MSVSLFLPVLGVLVAVLLLLLVRRTSAGQHDDRLPEELHGATLWQAEKSLTREKPVHVRGRPDEVWLKDNKRYILETKSRAGGVFEGDRMQVAAYAYLMREDGGPPLAPHGYIRFMGGEQSFAKVKLRGDDAIIDAHRRHRAVMKGKERAGFAKNAALCKGCGHRERCPGAKA